MEIAEAYEIKFHNYDGNEREITQFVNQYSKIRESKRNEGNVNAKVLSYFFDGLLALTNADESFWSGDNQGAYTNYQEALRMFNRFKNSRNSDARLDRLSTRMIHRATGLLNLTDAIIIKDKDTKEDLFSQALNNFNEEVSLANVMNEQMSSYAAFARASFTESQILLNVAIRLREEDPDEAKKSLLNSRASLKQACYIDPRFLSFMETVETTLDDLTRHRLLRRAEIHADNATEKSEAGQYKDAKTLFHKAMLLHKRASSLAADTGDRRKLLASATIYEASIHETEASQFFRIENNTKAASGKYLDASKYVDKSIALMGHFGSKGLIDNLKCQSNYYKAMSNQSSAITEFDEDQFPESKTKFEDALQLFENVIKLATISDNEVLVNMSNEAIADVKGYLSMVEAMI
ncbi:MAG: hypothetical protein HeimC2_04010 [Candidatus Heimdallarchaeota archaeon LC_2]|nr:MAG: hypothetical protein HeimC2_04010 [Candidatus Heimdallarchaeota archaeon LC_2]